MGAGGVGGGMGGQPAGGGILDMPVNLMDRILGVQQGALGLGDAMLQQMQGLEARVGVNEQVLQQMVGAFNLRSGRRNVRRAP